MATNMTTEVKPDIKVQVARSSWGPRYTAAGIPSADFQEVAYSIFSRASSTVLECVRIL